ncbi:MAG: hypothetical protein ACOZJX_17230 [Pseudomonadota bacterium]
MGDAMGGIYTPILSGLTLAVLLLQVRMQADFNRHTYDESYVQSARSDIDFYLQRLAQELDRPQDYGLPVGAFLCQNFSRTHDSLTVLARDFNRNHQRVFSLWNSFYTVVAGLSVHDRHPYNLAMETAKQRAYTLLTFECCVALDNYMSCVTEGRPGVTPIFARGLSEDSAA